ncbi:MAG: tetratricopeptide repeat protein [Myxococcota bacterium]
MALYRAADHPDLADSLQFLGILYEGSLNDYDAALEQFEAALAAARRFEEKQTLVAKMLVSIARIYRLRGEYEPALDNVRRAREALTEGAEEQLTEILLETANIYWYRGNYRRARRAQSEALELSLRRADTFRRIQALGVGGLIALNQGELTEAENLIRAALELSRLVARPSEEAAQLNNLGVVLQRGGRLDEAIQSFRNALAIDEQLGSREGRAFDLRNLGTALGRKERYDEALAALDEALTLSRELGNRFNEIQSLFYRGEVLLALGRGAEAGAMFEESATLATQFAIPEVQWRSLYALGRLEEDRAQERSARQYYRDALQVSERLGRSSEAAGEVSTRDDLYEDAVRLAVKAEDLDEVFNLFDRRRARARLDAFANRTVTFAEPEAQEMLRAERRARDAVIAAERELSRDGDNAVAAVDSARQAQRMRYLELQARFPRIARAFTIAPVALGDVLDSLPSGSGAVSFLVGRRRSWALLLQPEGARVFELEVTRENLRPLLAEIEESMRAFAPIDQALTAASGLLFGPMADELSALSHLVVVSDSGLAAIPYAALPLGESRLVDALTLSEASSMSAIVDLLKVPAAKARTVSAFAYGSDLPYARLEARAVDPTPILGGAATADALRRDRSDAWDLAVHATLDPADPLASTLEMADGRLEAAEVFSFERVARLVTLSGCETARAVRSGAQLSLAEAFITGGAQSVIATRHRVADFSAARAMKWFYRYLPSQSTAEALRQAMQTIREERPHPAHWATFSLVGDFR